MLQSSIQKRCMNEAQLLANIAKVVNKTPVATWQMLNRNTSKDLMSVHVVKAISDYTGLSQDEILITEKVEA